MVLAKETLHVAGGTLGGCRSEVSSSLMFFGCAQGCFRGHNVEDLLRVLIGGFKRKVQARCMLLLMLLVVGFQKTSRSGHNLTC